MEKDFQNWCFLKKELNDKDIDIYFKKREIWWCSLGVNVGFEQDGKNNKFERPVLVLRKFNKDLLLVLPTTSQRKEGQYYYEFISNGKKYSVILSQLRAISSKRLLRKIRKISAEDFVKIKELVVDIIKNEPSAKESSRSFKSLRSHL